VPVDVAWVTAIGTKTVAPNAGGANAGVAAMASSAATAAIGTSLSSALNNGNKDSEANEQPEINSTDPRAAIRDFWKSMSQITFGSELLSVNRPAPTMSKKPSLRDFSRKFFAKNLTD